MKKIFLFFILLGLTTVAFSYVTEKPSAGLSKSLAFPVSGPPAKIGSFWGDVRDGGKRSHEGLDIFARKGTPVVAFCSGIVTSLERRQGVVKWCGFSPLDIHGRRTMRI